MVARFPQFGRRWAVPPRVLVPVLLYFTYMMLASLLFFLVTGTVGFLSAWAFVHVIYGAIKVD